MDDLEELRREISEVDRELLEIVANRMEISGLIGELKAARGIGILDRDVEDQVVRRAKLEGRKLGLDESLIEGIFSLLLEHSKREQERRRDDEDSHPGP